MRDLEYLDFYDAWNEADERGAGKAEFIGLIHRCIFPYALVEHGHLYSAFQSHRGWADDLYSAWVDLILEYGTTDGESHEVYWQCFADYKKDFGSCLSEAQLEALMSCTLGIVDEVHRAPTILMHSAEVLTEEQQARFSEALTELQAADAECEEESDDS